MAERERGVHYEFGKDGVTPVATATSPHIKASPKAEREPGFYWVRVDDDWGIAEWSGERWYQIGFDPGEECWGDTTDDRLFDEIDERMLRREDRADAIHALERAVNFGENANLLLQETLRRLGPAASPQPITDAQKTGERFLVWYTYAANTGEWFVASWDTINGEGWCVGNPNPHFCTLLLPDKDVTHYLPLPPDVKP